MIERKQLVLLIASLLLLFIIEKSYANAIDFKAVSMDGDDGCEGRKYCTNGQLPIRPGTTAYCLTGHRGYTDSEFAGHYVNNLLKVWNRKAVNSWSESEVNDRHYTYVMISVDNEDDNSLKLLEKANSIIHPHHFEVMLPEQIGEPVHADCSNNTEKPFPIKGLRWVHNLWNQFGKIKYCHNKIEEDERNQGWRFEYVMRVRTDGIFYQPVPFIKEKVNASRISMFAYPEWDEAVSDHFAIVHRNLSDTFFNFVDVLNTCRGAEEMFDCCCKGHQRFKMSYAFERDWPPECMLRRWLMETDLEFDEYEYSAFNIIKPDGTRKWQQFPWHWQ